MDKEKKVKKEVKVKKEEQNSIYPPLKGKNPVKW